MVSSLQKNQPGSTNACIVNKHIHSAKVDRLSSQPTPQFFNLPNTPLLPNFKPGSCLWDRTHEEQEGCWQFRPRHSPPCPPPPPACLVPAQPWWWPGLGGSLEGGWETFSPIPEFAPVTTQVPDAILSESYVRRLRSISKYISFLTRMFSYSIWSLIVRSATHESYWAPDTILIISSTFLTH